MVIRRRIYNGVSTIPKYGFALEMTTRIISIADRMSKNRYVTHIQKGGLCGLWVEKE